MRLYPRDLRNHTMAPVAVGAEIESEFADVLSKPTGLETHAPRTDGDGAGGRPRA